MTKTRKISLAVFSVLLSVLLILSGWMIYQEISSRQKEKEEFDTLTELVEVTPEKQPDETVTPTDTAPEPSENGEPLRDLSALFAQNRDCIGWLCIPDTTINYPVMHTPNNPQKYLRRSFYGEYSQSGVPFLDGRCIPGTTNLIIYGHNMKNGTMFSDLKKYLDDTFLREHPTIELQTADGVQRFTVTEVLKTDIHDQWYERISRDDGKQYLVLSTCYGSAKSGRLLIIATEN
jgi:sortase B